MAQSTVAVIGAGIVGVATALWAQREGLRVVLIDRLGPGEATSYGNGGVLAAASVVPVTVPGLAARAPAMLLDRDAPLFLRWGYLPRLAPWLLRYLGHATPAAAEATARALLPLVGDSLAAHQALAAGTAAERWLRASDYAFLYRDRAAFERDGFAWGLRRKLGYRWDELEGPALRDWEPCFAEAMGFAARLGGHGLVSDPGAYVKALAAHVAHDGGRVLRGAVEDVVHAGGRVTGVRVAGETLPCDAVVITAGVWSGALARGLGLRLPVESERGYHLELWEPSRMPRVPVMVAAGRFVATPMEGRLRLAGVVEFGGLRAPASRAPQAFLERAARAALPGLRWREARTWMGHRPVLPDSLPVIGAVPGVAGAWLGFGHHHVGLTAGAATGRLLAQLVAGRQPNIDLAPYAPERFL